MKASKESIASARKAKVQKEAWLQPHLMKGNELVKRKQWQSRRKQRLRNKLGRDRVL
jgi:hypothetical protein